MQQSFRYEYGKRKVSLAIDNSGLSMATAKLAEPGVWGLPCALIGLV